MGTKKLRRLQLRKENLRSLTPPEMGSAVGAAKVTFLCICSLERSMCSTQWVNGVLDINAYSCNDCVENQTSLHNCH